MNRNQSIRWERGGEIVLREVMLGETVGMTMHFRDDLETSALETF